MAADMVKMTFTIDATTAANIQALAEEWRVPKSEAIRRAVRQAREKQLLQTNERTPIDVLEHLERHPVLSVTQMRIRQASARRLRKDWKLRGTY
jgi:transposase-like protein